MPRAKSTHPTKTRPKSRVSILQQKPPVKSAAKRKRRRTLDGIPLKRKVVWVYDTDTPEFRAAWAKEREMLRNSRSDADIDAFLDAAARDIERSLDAS